MLAPTAFRTHTRSTLFADSIQRGTCKLPMDTHEDEGVDVLTSLQSGTETLLVMEWDVRHAANLLVVQLVGYAL